MRRHILTLLLLATGLVSNFYPVYSQPITPTLVYGNVNCCDFTPALVGFKIENPILGSHTHYMTGPFECNTVWGYEGNPALSVTITVYDTPMGREFNWSSNFPISRMIVKGGENCNVYQYSPSGAYSGTGLHPPLNTNNGKWYGISHIEWCFYPPILGEVEKTASGSYDHITEWSIGKSVAPAVWNIFKGDNAESIWTVSVTKTEYDDNFIVSGTLTISNPNIVPITLYGIMDYIYGCSSSPIAVTPVCPVTFPYDLDPYETLTCTYSVEVDNICGTGAYNEVWAYFAPGNMMGVMAQAPINFTANYIGPDNVRFQDPRFGVDQDLFSSAVFTYPETFSCSGNMSDYEGDFNHKTTYTNTAYITGTGMTPKQASASVDVTCWIINVVKTAETHYTRTWNWTIEKICPPYEPGMTYFLLSAGESYSVDYDVTLNASYTDSNWEVEGAITITNPAPITAKITSLIDIISPYLPATTNCTFPQYITAGGSLTCTYERSLPDGSNRVNTATASLQNHSYNHLGVPTPISTTPFLATANVSFDAPTTLVDECVSVTDSYAGVLGTVCYNSTLPYTFTYSRDIGFPSTTPCGLYNIVNTATFTTNDRGITGSDDCTITVNIPCGGCTLTPGYWKTHSVYGPAPYDDNWANLLPSGENSPFYLSGQTYYQVLWAETSGNVYYILAHAYIAAKLNFLNGADASAAQTAFNSATTLFNTYTPAQAAGLKGNQKKQWTDLATVLDNYNNGFIGPGHCSELLYLYSSSPLTENSIESTEAEGFSLEQNYPNPFSSSTNFIVTVPETCKITLNIYSLLGRRVATVYKGELSEGTYTFTYNAATSLPEGIYLYSLETGSTRIIKKMTIIR